jgi:hypothetical protein
MVDVWTYKPGSRMNVLEKNWSGINYSAKDRWSHGKMRSIIIRETESERNN